jgi:endonuclease/exonuclease/phosphatase family metal-dependent hydrolase
MFIAVYSLTLALYAALLATPFARPAPETPARSSVTIVTLNMARETSADRILHEWAASPRLRGADIFLLQEVKEDQGKQCIANRLGSELRLHVAYSAEGPGVLDRGLAILSRFPLHDVQVRRLKQFNLRIKSRNRFALSATADTPWGPLRLYDLHLDTRVNTADRLAQLEPVVRDSARFASRRVVAGDFNSNPFYWIEHLLPLPAAHSQAAEVDRFMKGRGFQSAVSESQTTFDYLGLHLDWIWMTGLRCVGTDVVPLDFSDHHAVWSRLEFL